jgi:hypothetical protein
LRLGRCCGAVLAAHLVMVGQSPQLHAVGFGALSQHFRGQCAVGHDGMAMKISVKDVLRRHRAILGFPTLLRSGTCQSHNSHIRCLADDGLLNLTVAIN